MYYHSLQIDTSHVDSVFLDTVPSHIIALALKTDLVPYFLGEYGGSVEYFFTHRRSLEIGFGYVRASKNAYDFLPVYIYKGFGLRATFKQSNHRGFGSEMYIGHRLGYHNLQKQNVLFSVDDGIEITEYLQDENNHMLAYHILFGRHAIYGKFLFEYQVGAGFLAFNQSRDIKQYGVNGQVTVAPETIKSTSYLPSLTFGLNIGLVFVKKNPRYKANNNP